MPNAGAHDEQAAAGAPTGVRNLGSGLRILVATPFPPRTGLHHGGRVIAQLLSRLAERHEVGLVHLDEPGAEEQGDLPRGLAFAEAIPHRHGSAWRRRWRVLAGPLRGVPSPVGALYSEALAAALVRRAESFRPQLVQVEHDSLAYCGSALRAAGSRLPLLLTCHEPGILAAQDQARVTRGRRRVAHELDVLAWRRYLARHLPAFDALVAFTDSDRRVIAPYAPAAATAIIGIGFDVPARPLDPAGEDETSVLFIGGYRHPPNVDAALRLLCSIMPLVRERHPGARLLLVGADPPPQLREAAGPLDTVTGPVPRVEPYMERAQVVAIPLRTGGGMRVKLLEALSAGKAVVASPLAAAGLRLTSGRELLLAESDEEFAEHIARLLADEELRRRIGRVARQWAVRSLSWESRVAEYEKLYASLVR
jgi:glycosyltransferase involved in cell wall biosynthesis